MRPVPVVPRFEDTIEPWDNTIEDVQYAIEESKQPEQGQTVVAENIMTRSLDTINSLAEPMYINKLAEPM